MSHYGIIKEKNDGSFNFRKIGNFDIGDIRKTVRDFNSEWEIDNTRNTKHGAQRETNVYWLVDVIEIHKLDQLKTMPKTDNIELLNKVLEVISYLEENVDGKLARAILARLPAGSRVYEHTDKGRLFESTHRFHIPLISNAGCKVRIGETDIHMEEGECWEINNLLRHSAVNLGVTDRIHLIFDIAPRYLLDMPEEN